MIKFYIVWQCILLIMLLIHDWVPMSPLNDLPTMRKHQTIRQTILYTIINSGACAWALGTTILFYTSSNHQFPYDPWVIYGCMTVGTILSWWVPYFFGSSAEIKLKMKPYRHTHTFLPKRSDNVRPNTIHVIVHLLIWSNFAIGLYLWL